MKLKPIKTGILLEKYEDENFPIELLSSINKKENYLS